ncbi:MULTISPECIES: EYxxD motif small membrane protein [Cytobacillus]|jgi:hypothetical protein|uniref:EYxxD motif small membrane protein n=1 Tax=Cytobacillus pseudoceanisediminis TaxID=3051614 RepID=A0ABZ2ZIG9_9BACI
MGAGKLKGADNMFWEYVMDMTFVLAAIIGSIVALLFVYIRKTKKGRAR